VLVLVVLPLSCLVRLAAIWPSVQCADEQSVYGSRECAWGSPLEIPHERTLVSAGGPVPYQVQYVTRRPTILANFLFSFCSSLRGTSLRLAPDNHAGQQTSSELAISEQPGAGLPCLLPNQRPLLRT